MIEINYLSAIQLSTSMLPSAAHKAIIPHENILNTAQSSIHM